MVGKNFNAGPLTTVFEPPSSCTQTYTLGADTYAFSQNSSLFIGNFNGGYTGKHYLREATNCYPRATSEIDFWDNYYYSPAYCPRGYTTACDFKPNSGFPNSVTARVCCPTGYGCAFLHGCQNLTSGTISNVFVVTAPTATIGDASALTTLALDGEQYIWGDGVPVAWQSTDVAVLDMIAKQTAKPTSTPTSSAVPSRSTPTQPPETSSPSSSSSSSASSSSLGIGAIIGMVVGAIAAVVLFGMALMYFMRRKGNKTTGEQRHHAYEVSASQRQVYEAPNSQAEEKYARYQELYTPPGELGGDTIVPHELDAKGPEISVVRRL